MSREWLCDGCRWWMGENTFRPHCVVSHPAGWSVRFEKVSTDEGCKHFEPLSCFACPHAIDGAVIDGHEFPDGWHCDAFDVAGTHASYKSKDCAVCRVPELWEE